jgi:hypothetical protein
MAMALGAGAGAGPIVVACPATIANTPGYAMVIAHYLDPTTNIRSFFIGQESVYKADSTTRKFFRNMPDTETNLKARIAYAKTDRNFVKGTDHVVIRPKPGTVDKYKYTIQELPPSPFHGFPKGAGLNVKEQSVDIAKREFEEEIGYTLPRDPIYKKCIEFESRDNSGNKIPMVCVVFHYEIADATEKAKIESDFAAKMTEEVGEMFQATFKTAAEITDPRFKINNISKTAFQNFDADHRNNVDQTNIPKGGPLLQPAPAPVPPPAPAPGPAAPIAFAKGPIQGQRGFTSRAPAPAAGPAPAPAPGSAPGAAPKAKYVPPHRRPAGGARKRKTQRKSRRQRKQTRKGCRK